MASYEIRKIELDSKSLDQPYGAVIGVIPRHPFRMYMVGASGSGKTNLLLNLLTRKDMYKDYFNSILVMSPTALDLDPAYKKLGIDEKHFFPVSTKVLEKIRDVQVSRKKSSTDPTPKTLVILDDIISYTKFCNSDVLRQFAVMGRHWGISMILLTQAYHSIPKVIRLQMSCIIYFKGSNRETETLVEDFMPPGTGRAEFRNTVERATVRRYSFLFIDMNRSIEDGRYRRNLTEQLIF